MEVDFNYPFRIYPITDRPKNLFIYVMVGLPGVGKTTFSQYIKESCPNGLATIISRDEMRAQRIWENRKLSSNEQRAKNLSLDYQVTLDCLEQFNHELTIKKHRVIIFDGCHTNVKELVPLLLYIRENGENWWKGKVILSLIFIGGPNTKTNIRLNTTRPEDYLDYKDKRGAHDSVPKRVFLKKKEQYRELQELDNLEKVLPICDFVYQVDPVLIDPDNHFFYNIKSR